MSHRGQRMMQPGTSEDSGGVLTPVERLSLHEHVTLFQGDHLLVVVDTKEAGISHLNYWYQYEKLESIVECVTELSTEKTVALILGKQNEMDIISAAVQQELEQLPCQKVVTFSSCTECGRFYQAYYTDFDGVEINLELSSKFCEMVETCNICHAFDMC